MFSHHIVEIIPSFVSNYKQIQFQTLETKLKRDSETNPNRSYGFIARDCILQQDNRYGQS